MKKEDWTGIHFLEKTSYYDGKKNRLMGLVWIVATVAGFMLSQLSAFSIFFAGLSMTFNGVLIGGLMIILSLIFFLLSFKWQLFWSGVGVCALGLGLFAWLRFDPLSQGLVSIYERAFTLAADYYMEGTVDAGVWSGVLSQEVYIFIAVFLILYGAICFWGLKSSVPVAFPGALGILGVFLVGQVPDLLWMGVFLFSICILVAGSYTSHRFGKFGTLTALRGHFYVRGDQKAAAKIGAGTAVAAAAVLTASLALSVLVGNIAGLPEEDTLRGYQQQVRSWTQEHFQIFSQWGQADRVPQGGINGGDLASVGDLYYHGDQQLRVQVDVQPDSGMYIKGYVGDYYENNRWNTDDSGSYSQFLEEYAIDGEQEGQLLNLTYNMLSEFGSAHMTIEKLAVFGSYEFFPYGAYIQDSQGWLNDLYIPGTESSSSFYYAPMVYPLAGAFDDLTAYGEEVFANYPSLENLEASYRNFVYDHYTQVPEDTQSMLNDFTQGVVPETLSEKVSYIRALLGRTCEYTLTPGDLPAGQDFTEYFLMENQRGYCTHFATAATLLLRNMGVPARYVEGYILVPGNFSASEDGYEAIVYDHQAHAWAEIYVDGAGWVPVEMTPTYYDSSELTEDASETDETETETAAESETQSETYVPQSETTQSQTDSQSSASETDAVENNGGESSQGLSGGESGFFHVVTTILWGILLICAVILILGAAIFLRASALTRQRNRRIRQKNRNRAVKAIYSYTLDLFEKMGYRQMDYKNLHAFFEAVAKDYDFVDVDALDEMVTLANQAAFSRDGIKPEQWQACRQAYQSLRSRMLKGQTWWRRLLLQYIYCC